MTLQYKNHAPGSAKGYVHKVYDEKGEVAARKEGIKRGVTIAVAYNYIGEFRAADLAKKAARKSGAKKVAKKATKKAVKKAAKKPAAKKAPAKPTKPAKAPAAKKPRTPKPVTEQHTLHG